ncbi:hypothetical protein CMsap09_15075 [Clavibacter michiganensis]|uniref:2,3-bisphosphoglycerate-dependent phosphoglycerate mutase n=1 Tax=Clavibacter michiganensis TaxID=28447 RepID=A0A251XYA6_9MICO|nr:hypothetical protein CMsap09_15075 [Clavibacter michiganensis]
MRARAVLDDVAADPRTTLVVAHGYLLRVLYLTALGRSPALTRSLVWANGQLIGLERDHDGRWREAAPDAAQDAVPDGTPDARG